MSAGRVLLLILGLLAIVIGLAVLFGGGSVMAATGAITDSEGFMSTGEVRLERDSYAITTGYADIRVDPEWAEDWCLGNLATIRVEARSADPAKPVFIGIAESSDLKAYLEDVRYDEIRDISYSPTTLTYRTHAGAATPEPPTSQQFWAASACGSGVQTLDWDLQTGNYALVLMNADGTAGIDVSGSLGARVPIVPYVAGGLLAGGGVILLIGAGLIFLALRRR